MPDAEIVVDRDACMGSGTCVALAPSTFAQDAEIRAVVIDPTGDDLVTIEEAVNACPMGALSLVRK
ncbi:MAG TPA: ferredoxin [Mycobacteriales bacterium]|nr:ferredoxin [Mycobacteriales bacterium]HWA65386.1 ferredoxin [Mycobacteriales bacterium]